MYVLTKYKRREVEDVLCLDVQNKLNQIDNSQLIRYMVGGGDSWIILSYLQCG